MAITGVRVWLSRHGEPILAALVAHELAAGAAFTVAGLPGVGSFLWAVGTGLALAYLLVNLPMRIRVGRRPQLFVVTTVLLASATAAAVGGVYGLGNALGLLGMLAVMIPPRRPGPRVASVGHTANARTCDEQSRDRA
ncbi:hypothetical protein [Kutzneria kofuensis]|uniref:Low temperature requirement A protein (LtrA) n=1 Tax=Kutzneria kofuensis TaxID=103725 RepID=A0A7W9KST1_9PSEU|nr:hypothetical protein [Kutzneria kofuensis]MBB5898067.1 hypothetical protein [Kutzneria kofuensis]